MTSALIIALALGFPAQRAPPPTIEWISDFAQAIEQAKTRNAVIFLTFHKDKERKGSIQRRSTFKNPPFVQLAREELICLIAHFGTVSGTEHEPVEGRDPKTGAVVYECPLYGKVDCAKHRALYRQLRGRYKFKEPPATFLLDPNGEILIGPEGFPTVGVQAVQKVREAQSKLEGRTLTARKYKKILRDLDRAEGKLSEEKYTFAISAFRKILKRKGITEPLRARVQEALDDINEIGLQLIEKGRAVQAEDPERAMKIWKKVRKEFKGMEAWEKAKQVIREAEEGKK